MTFSQRQNHSRVYILLPQKQCKNDLLEKLLLFHCFKKHQSLSIVQKIIGMSTLANRIAVFLRACQLDFTSR